MDRDGLPGERQTLRVVVVDDEPLARAELVHLLAEVDGVDLVGEAQNGVDAVELIGAEQPDIAFLDIQMPGLDGFQVVTAIQRLRITPHVVFVTAYDQYALRAFEVSATDYLLKPVDRTRLVQAVDRIRSHMDRPRLEALLGAIGNRHLRRIPVRRDDRVGLIDADDLVYAFVSDGAVFAVTSAAQELTGYRTLDELESDLDPDVFVRVHRSYIANLGKVEEIIPWFSGTYHLKMAGAGDQEIPLSRSQAKRLRKLLKW